MVLIFKPIMFLLKFVTVLPDRIVFSMTTFVFSMITFVFAMITEL